MRKASFLVGALVALSGLLSAGPAEAQPAVRVEISGLPPGVTVELVLVAANLNKTENVTAGATGSTDSILDFANLGKAQLNPQGEQVQVFIIDCKEPQEVRRVVMVAEGGQVPPECDEQRTDTGEGCDCRRGAFVLFSDTQTIRINFQTGTVQAFRGPGPGGMPTGMGDRRYFVVIGGGGEYSRNNEIELSPPQSGLSGPTGTVEDGGWSGTFFLEGYPIPWLGGGYAYQSMASAILDEIFTLTTDPNFNVTFRSEFNPYAHNFYVVAAFPPQSPVQLVVRGGVNYFKSEENAVQIFRRGTDELSRNTRRLEADGWGPLLGIEGRFWPVGFFGGGVRFTWEKLKHEAEDEDDREIDDTYYKFAIIGMVRF